MKPNREKSSNGKKKPNGVKGSAGGKKKLNGEQILHAKMKLNEGKSSGWKRLLVKRNGRKMKLNGKKRQHGWRSVKISAKKLRLA